MLKVVAVWEERRVPGGAWIVGVKLGDRREDRFRGIGLVDVKKI